mgnify:CR=1 FL=1
MDSWPASPRPTIETIAGGKLSPLFHRRARGVRCGRNRRGRRCLDLGLEFAAAAFA